MKTQNLTIEQNHKDIKILAEKLKENSFKYDPKCKFQDGEYIATDMPQLRHSMTFEDGITKEGNYIRIAGCFYWDKKEIAALEKAIHDTNIETNEYDFVLGDASDWELEWDGDRSWPAAFTFYSHKK
tara:strand:+ start:10904 stop:11284 length:381 start_codon:yes stop_codon:yes gene_type:complete